ncbi:benzoylformate decarboxylase [Sphingosinicella terrae]|uniref:benzoylformate decarboxylase n=1 Tax=Sphingosinicella terrae TaxID=2172047 RepID=UPI000E0D6B4A|nr:benzoylformate decarboxylase [Sphingosinicella terrae]
MSAAVTVREAVFALLRAHGMTTIFGNPGSTELPMFRDFPEDFRYVLGLQESVALGMADGFAQATRNAALVNLHSAVGVGHALGNLFTAFRNRTPLVVIAGQQARSILPFQPFLYAEQATEFPKPYVKWSFEPARAEDVPAAIARAYHVAMQPPRGPVFVSVPVDDWDRPCEAPAPRAVGRAPRGDARLLDELGRALAKAERPVLVVGAEAARDEAWAETIALAERHLMPVWVSPMSSRNAFPEDHKLFAGFLEASREAIVRDLAGHDLVLALGAPVFTYHVEGFGPHVPPESRLYQLIDDPLVAAASPVGTAIVGNIREGLRELLAGPAPGRRPEPARFDRPNPPAPEPLTDAYLLSRVAALRPAGSIVVEEAPSSRGAMHDFLPITDPDGFYTCASGGLGFSMPAAVGIALGRPGEKVIALIGDGSAMYAPQALWSAAQLGLPVSFVIVNNRRYEALLGFGRRFGVERPVGTQLPGIDFCALAEAQGVAAARVESAERLDAALRSAFDSPSPGLVEVVVA